MKLLRSTGLKRRAELFKPIGLASSQKRGLFIRTAICPCSSSSSSPFFPSFSGLFGPIFFHHVLQHGPRRLLDVSIMAVLPIWGRGSALVDALCGDTTFASIERNSSFSNNLWWGYALPRERYLFRNPRLLEACGLFVESVKFILQFDERGLPNWNVSITLAFQTISNSNVDRVSRNTRPRNFTACAGS